MNANKILRYSIISGIFLLPFICLIVSDHLFFPFITGKNFTFRIIVEIITALWIILALRDNSYLPKSSRLFQAFAIFVAVIFISDLLSPNVHKSFWSNYERMEGWFTLAHLFALFAVASSVLTKKVWHSLFHTGIGVGIFLYVYSVLQLNHELLINQGGVRIDGTFGNATYLAIFMLFLIFFTVLSIFDTKEGSSRGIMASGFVGFGLSVFSPFIRYFSRLLDFNRFNNHFPSAQEKIANNIHFFTGPLGVKIFWLSVLALVIIAFLWFYEKNLSRAWRVAIRNGFYILALISEFYVLYNTATRGATLGLLGGLFLAAILIAVFEKNQSSLKKISIGGIVAVILLVGGFWTLKNADFVKNSPVLSRFSSLSVTDKTTTSRFQIWNMAYQGFKERPIFGWGQESFNYVFNKYYDSRMYSQEQWFDRAHDVFFDWLVAGGILGILSYLSLFIFALYYLWKRDSPFSLVERSFITGLFAGYFFHNLTVFDNITSYMLFVFVIAYINSGVGSVSQGLKNKISAFPSGVKNRIMVPVVAVLIIFVIYRLNVPSIRAASSLISALSGQSGGAMVNFSYFEKAFSYKGLGDSEIREQLVQKTSEAISNQSVDLKIKNAFFDLSRKEMDKQLKLTPDDARYFLFAGSLLGRAGDFDNAIAGLKKAHELSPKKQTILFELGSVYLSRRDYPNAEATLKQAFLLDQTFDEARKIYAISLVYAKKDGDAQEILKSLQPESYLGDQRLLIAYFSSGYFGRALDSVNYLIKKNPTNGQYYFTLAAIHVQMQNRAQALSDIAKAVSISPSLKEQADYFTKQIKEGKSI